MASIFLSYRRSDVRGSAGRLYDALSKRFPTTRIFRDIDAIPPGQPFASYIRDAIGSCHVFIALIGPTWATTRDENGNPRLSDPEDYVRMEIIIALERGIPVIPALVDGATMPSKKALPEPLRGLCDRQAFEIVDALWEESCNRLAKTLRPLLSSVEPGRSRFTKYVAAVGALSIVALALGATWALLRQSPPKIAKLDNMKEFQCASEGQIKSTVGGDKLDAVFENQSNAEIQVYWLNVAGRRDEEKYWPHVVAPHTSYYAKTYASHAWLLTHGKTCIAIVVPISEPAIVTVR